MPAGIGGTAAHRLTWPEGDSLGLQPAQPFVKIVGFPLLTDSIEKKPEPLRVGPFATTARRLSEPLGIDPFSQFGQYGGSISETACNMDVPY
jgi:hypothetical protein